jgi:hypothetical protein
MKLLAVFVDANTKRKVAIKPFDVRRVDQGSNIRTSITYSTWENDDECLKTFEVVGDFESVVEKLEKTS